MSSVYFVAIIITTQDGPGKCFGFHSNRKQKPLQHSDCLNDVKIKIYSPIDASYSMIKFIEIFVVTQWLAFFTA